MKKLFLIFESKHYRYIISGFIIYFINDSLFEYLSNHYQSSELWKRVIFSSEIALLVSFPIHKYFTFLTDSKKIVSELYRFLFFGHSLLLLRFFSFIVIFYLTSDINISSILSIIILVLLNFAIFDRYVFNLSAYLEQYPDPYGENGSGIETLETIEDAKNYNTWLCEKFEDYLGTKNLELGAGKGTLSAIIAEQYPIELFEISDKNHSFLLERFKNTKNIVRIEKDFMENFDWGKYDCIYSSNVLEHIELDDKFIIHGLKLLKTGGYFVAIVPAMSILYSKFDKKIGHIRRYEKSDISRIKKSLLTSSIPFEFKKASYFNPIGALGWLVKMKLMRIDKINKRDAMTMNALIPFISVLDYLPLPFGQSLFFVIQKN